MACRNVSRYLLPVFKNISKLTNYNVIIVVVYDNCRDDTENILYKIKKNIPNEFYIKKLENNNSLLRTVRIANARNACLDILDKIDTNYHIFLDPDNVNIEEWDISVIDYYIKKYKKWDIISFNRKE
jgi:hypothetical protein